MAAKYTFIATNFNRWDMAKDYLPGVFLIIGGILAHLFLPEDPETGNKYLETGLISTLLVFSGLVWMTINLISKRKRKLLIIDSSAIRLFSGSGLLALPGDYGQIIDQIDANEIHSIECSPSRTLGARIIKRKAQVVVRHYLIKYNDKEQFLSDVMWQPDINTYGALKDETTSLGLNDFFKGRSKPQPGLFEAFKKCAYPVDFGNKS